MNLWAQFMNVMRALWKSPSLTIQVPISVTGYKKPMNESDLTVNRMIFTNNSTVGELWLDGKFFCYTLEPSCRKQADIKGAIPPGRYMITIQYSNKFGKKMPFLADVPNFEGIMFHPGNFPADTLACILVGDSKGPDYIGQSRQAFDRIMPIIKERIDSRMLFVSVLGGGIKAI
jgi:hypothetical protein